MCILGRWRDDPGRFGGMSDRHHHGAAHHQSGPAGDPVARFKENFGARAYTFPELQLDMLPIGGLTAFPRAAAQRLLEMSRRLRSDAARLP